MLLYSKCTLPKAFALLSLRCYRCIVCAYAFASLFILPFSPSVILTSLLACCVLALSIISCQAVGTYILKIVKIEEVAIISHSMMKGSPLSLTFCLLAPASSFSFFRLVRVVHRSSLVASS